MHGHRIMRNRSKRLTFIQGVVKIKVSSSNVEGILARGLASAAVGRGQRLVKTLMRLNGQLGRGVRCVRRRAMKRVDAVIAGQRRGLARLPPVAPDGIAFVFDLEDDR